MDKELAEYVESIGFDVEIIAQLEKLEEAKLRLWSKVFDCVEAQRRVRANQARRRWWQPELLFDFAWSFLEGRMTALIGKIVDINHLRERLIAQAAVTNGRRRTR